MILNDIPPQLLHKGSADDVLIHRYRPAPPLYLNDTIGTASVVRADNEVLADLYVMCDEARCRLDVPLDERGHFVADASLSGGVSLDATWEMLRAVPYQVLEPWLAQKDRGSRDSQPLDDAIARIVSAYGEERRGSSSYEMINRADHYYFYRKEHEHVPGVMLIEAQRQAVYYHLYKHTRHQRGKVTVSLNELNSAFYAYAELMYPIELVVDDLTPGNAPCPRNIHYRVSFYQRMNLIAVIDTKASVIEMTRFEKIRNIFITSDNWYMPVDQARVQCTIATRDEARSDALLLAVSETACVTRSVNIEHESVRSLVVSDAEGVTFLQDVAFDRELGDQMLWRFVNVTPDKVIDIGRVIKRGFVVAARAPDVVSNR
ncbi:AfsA-related hotdog domain-containing protein [Paraburkholderia bryophila]|uniref:AfsA-related hotdog domain-containing protein n=1 Tax=Burkholderiaceae TaxID=119060 RepID=UPI0006908573|nr:AfsA-related hotdog domain-containing protein [Burkholderia sp. 9120]